MRKTWRREVYKFTQLGNFKKKKFNTMKAAVSFEEIARSGKADLGNFKVTNHRGEFKNEYTAVEGVELLAILEKKSRWKSQGN